MPNRDSGYNGSRLFTESVNLPNEPRHKQTKQNIGLCQTRVWLQGRNKGRLPEGTKPKVFPFFSSLSFPFIFFVVSLSFLSLSHSSFLFPYFLPFFLLVSLLFPFSLRFPLFSNAIAVQVKKYRLV